mgnify:CR=1 FL=1
MKLLNLHIKNIGPFKEASLDFATEFRKGKAEPVTIITGINGAGKSILIDAIRAAFCGMSILERDIVADEKDFYIKMQLENNGNKEQHVYAPLHSVHSLTIPFKKQEKYPTINKVLRDGYEESDEVFPWVVDFWSAKTPSGSFQISNMMNINHRDVLKNAMSGVKSNIDLVNFICQVDYLRNSEMPEEKSLGEVVYNKLKEIVEACLDNGTFKYVRRSNLTPIVEQNGVELSLEKLSSGNLFLLEHLLLLLCKMYSISVLRNTSPEEISNTPGVLLIDEIETHMHPKWQKKIVGIIRHFFPNLQIILTTHSPFVVASTDGARIYTCVPQTGYSEVHDETERYAHMPVEEVLMSDAFGEVHPFNDQITELMHERKRLIASGQKEEAENIAKKLYDINPEYFAYLNFEGGI